MPDHFTPVQWLLAGLAAFGIGFAKSGFSGAGLLNVVIMARLFGGRESTGVVLPMLICGDIFSVLVFHRHARWSTVWRMLPPTAVGIVGGYLLMLRLPRGAFEPIIGWIVLLMVALQGFRRWAPAAFERVPHTRAFAWSMGGGAGFATMLANGAGPVMSLYLLATQTPKYVLVGTSAWFFLIVNLFKVPFSVQLGVIHADSLRFNLLLIPAIALGIFAGQSLIRHVPQTLFETLLLLFATVAAFRLLGLF